jgi:hypothetical protein
MTSINAYLHKNKNERLTSRCKVQTKADVTLTE